jgi:O-antigen ligase
MKKINSYLSLNNIYLFLVIFLPIGLLISSGVSESTKILIIIIFLITCFYKNDFRWLKNKYCYLLILIWLSLLLNLLFSENFNLSFVRNITFFKNIIFVFAMCYILKKEKNLKLIFILYLIISLVVTFDIFFEYFNKKNILGFQSYDPTRIASFLGKELKIGAFVLGFSFISTSYYFEKYSSKSINYKILGLFLIIIFFISLLLTGERANSLKGTIMIILFILFSKKEIFKYKKTYFTIILIISIFTYLFSERARHRFDVILLPAKNIGIIEAFKETQHGAHFDTAIKIFKKYTFFGVGNKNFREECLKDEYLNSSYKRTSERCSTHPHQIYYELLSEHGLIGTIIITSVIFFVLFRSIKIYFRNRNSIHLASILFVSVQFLPLFPSGSFFTSWDATIFWLNFSIIIFYNTKVKNLHNKIN